MFLTYGLSMTYDRTLVITIDENGSIMAEIEGIKGEACLTELEALLGSGLEIADEFQKESKIDHQQQSKFKKTWAQSSKQ